MPAPEGFSWIDKPLLAAMARPADSDEFVWLREHGIEFLIALTEDPPRRDWVNNAGLFLVHVPVVDMTPPTQAQIDQCMSVIERAHQQNMGVGVHCGAGMGRTGVILACYFVRKDMSAKNAIARIRRLRPGSIETEEQVEAVTQYAERLGKT